MTSLRDKAAAIAAKSDKSAIGILRARLDADQLAEVDDLLYGEPRVEHTVVARVLSDAFDVRIAEKQVQEFRRKPRP